MSRLPAVGNKLYILPQNSLPPFPTISIAIMQNRSMLLHAHRSQSNNNDDVFD